MRKCLPLLAIVLLAVGAGCGESIPRIDITEVLDNENGTLQITYVAREFSSNEIDITCSYSAPDGGGPATAGSGGDGVTALTTSDSGMQHTFTWDYKTDLGIGRHTGLAFTIVPYGPDGKGRAGTFGAFNVGRPILYTANQSAGTVSIVDIADEKVSSTAAVGSGPKGIIALPDETKLYVTNSGSGTVSVVDIEDPTIVYTVTVGASPAGIAVDPLGECVYVVNQGDGTVSVIDALLTTPAVVDTYTVGTTPVACSLTQNGDSLFVTNSGDDTVSLLIAANGTPLMGPINTGANPVAIDTGSRYTVVCNYDAGTVTVIDNSTVVVDPPEVAVESNPAGVVIDKLSEFAYVANYGSDTISIVNLEALTVVASIDLASMGSMGPKGLTVCSTGEHLWVTYTIASKLAKVEIASRTLLTTFSVGSQPVDVVILSK